jgi:hypothetical protein
MDPDPNPEAQKHADRIPNTEARIASDLTTSNAQALLVLLKKTPPKGRRLLVICTTSRREVSPRYSCFWSSE